MHNVNVNEENTNLQKIEISKRDDLMSENGSILNLPASKYDLNKFSPACRRGIINFKTARPINNPLLVNTAQNDNLPFGKFVK